MTSRVEFTRKALEEIEDAAARYEARQPGLGEAFVEAARETAKRIRAYANISTRPTRTAATATDG